MKVLAAIAHSLVNCFLAHVVVPAMDWALKEEPPEAETYRPWAPPPKEEKPK